MSERAIDDGPKTHKQESVLGESNLTLLKEAAKKLKDEEEEEMLCSSSPILLPRSSSSPHSSTAKEARLIFLSTLFCFIY